MKGLKGACVLSLAVLAVAVAGTPVDRTDGEQVAEARSVFSPSKQDPVRRDGAHHHGGGGGGGHHGGGASFGGHSSSYSSQPNSFVSTGFSGGGGGGHHISSNQIIGSSYGAPQQSYAAPVQSYGAPVQQSYGAPQAPKQTGYYYYYYPVTIQEDNDKKGGKGFFDSMKKLFEPMMYPWNAMMEYFGYGDDYDSYDYDYDSYGSYARSFTSRASDYIPWDVINEVGGHVTQDQCVEFYMCELGAYAREYRNMHFLMDYLLPDNNEYYRSFKDSVKNAKDCYTTYNCPIIRRRAIGEKKQTIAEEKTKPAKKE